MSLVYHHTINQPMAYYSAWCDARVDRAASCARCTSCTLKAQTPRAALRVNPRRNRRPWELPALADALRAP